MSKRIFYHGTHEDAAYSILRQGFKVGAERSGRNLGGGLYLTAQPGFAAWWGPVIIRCQLRPGTRMLWHTPVDAGTIKYLKKEFGAGITRLGFSKLVPANKQLTRSEAAHLWNYILESYYLHPSLSRRDSFPRWVKSLSLIYKHLKRHGYDGVGMRDQEWPEMFLFNPSRAVPLSVHTYTKDRNISGTLENVTLSQPLTLRELREMQESEMQRRNV